MKLSEEEKKAIEWLEKANYFSARLYAPTIRNLIDQYQKEIEDLKIRLQDTLSRQKNTLYFCIDDYVSKDKIRKIFQFYIERDSLFTDDTHKMAVIRLKDVLQELLEEK